jgi:predicted nucleotidyltransferase
VKLPVELPLLTEAERSCLERYLDLLVERLGEQLLEVSVFGSVARGESWPDGMPIRSDLDLLVVTRQPLPTEEVDALVDATLPLFLECGRQIGPQFRTRQGLAEGSPEYLEELACDAIAIYGPILQVGINTESRRAFEPGSE